LSVEIGSGNVFADLGLPEPTLALAKAQLVQRIRKLIVVQKLTQAQAAKLLSVDQPKISALVRGRTSGFTLDRLMKYLNLLGQDIEIVLPPPQPQTLPAQIRVRHT